MDEALTLQRPLPNDVLKIGERAEGGQGGLALIVCYSLNAGH